MSTHVIAPVWGKVLTVVIAALAALSLVSIALGPEPVDAAQLAPIGARWEGRGRVDDFLVSLAGVETRSGQGHRPSADTEARGPVIAVLGNPHLQTVDWLVRRRSPRDVGGVVR